jgi:hypothetical protein
MLKENKHNHYFGCFHPGGFSKGADSTNFEKVIIEIEF